MSADIATLIHKNKERLIEIENGIMALVKTVAEDVNAVIAHTPDDIAAEGNDDFDDYIAAGLEIIFNGEAISANPYTEAADLKRNFYYILSISQDDQKMESEVRPALRQMIAKWGHAQMLNFEEIYDEADEAIQSDIGAALDLAAEQLDYYQSYAGSFVRGLGGEKNGNDNFTLAEDSMEVAQSILPELHNLVIAGFKRAPNAAVALDGQDVEI